MALENLVGADKFLNALVPTNPTGGDDKREGDDHIRGIKNTIKNSFPNITGAVTLNQGELNALPGSLDGKVDVAGDTMTGSLTINSTLHVTGSASFDAYVDAGGTLRARGPIALDAGTSGVYAGIAGGLVSQFLVAAAGAVNERVWQTHSDGASLSYRACNDENSSASTWLRVLRTGINIANVAFPVSRFGIGTLSPAKNLDVASSGSNVNIGVRNSTATGFASLRLNDPDQDSGANGGALHQMGSAYPSLGAYFAGGTTLTSFEAGGLNFSVNRSAPYRIFNGAAGDTLRVSLDGAVWDAGTLQIRADGYMPPGGPSEVTAGAARNQFTQRALGSAAVGHGWIGAAFGDSTGNRVIIGQYSARAIIGAHTGGLNGWAPLDLQAQGYNLRDDAGNVQVSLSAANVFSYGGLEVGYRDVPRVTGGIERGKCWATAAGFTVNVGTAGAYYRIYNDSNNAITVTQGAGVTLRLGGSNTTGNRGLNPHTFAELWYNAAGDAILNGPGVT